ncbi:hypothetical protein EEB14_33955 [Rhodococcus sp. WS4]|nr:hypothetical protein EEB14_33955 [Rhodococcus sp. WS4]
MLKFAVAKSLMGRFHERSFGEQNLVRTLVRTTYICYALVAVVVVMVLAMMFSGNARIPNTTEDFTKLTRVQFFAQNFMTIWLTGTDKDVPAIKEMVSAPSALPDKWNPEPMEISDLNVADIKSTGGVAFTEWVVTVGATLIPPGTAVPQRNYFAVTVIEKDGSFRALTMPRPVNITRAPVSVQTGYTNSVGSATPLGTSVTNFVAAFYTQNTSGSLGRYVSSDFDPVPIANSPYTSAEVLSIKSREAVDMQNGTAGDTAELLVTIKSAMSLSTYNTIEVPMTVQRTDNGQWLVSSIEDITKISDDHVAVGGN